MKGKNITNLDFLNGEKICDFKSYESNIYLYEGKIYKIFKQNNIDNIKNKEEKVKLLSTLNSDSLIFPKDLVYHNDKFIGYTMNYIYSKTLYDYLFSKTKEKISLLKKVKEVIEEAHRLGIILGDISLHNILVDDDKKIYICDTDNCSIDNLFHDNLKIFQQDYLEDHKYDENLDYFVFNIETMNLLTRYSSQYILPLMQTGLYKNLIDEKAFKEFIYNQRINGSPYLIDHLKENNLKEKLLSIFK